MDGLCFFLVIHNTVIAKVTGALGGLVRGKVGVDDERAVHWCLLVHSL